MITYMVEFIYSGKKQYIYCSFIYIFRCRFVMLYSGYYISEFSYIFHGHAYANVELNFKSDLRIYKVHLMAFRVNRRHSQIFL